MSFSSASSPQSYRPLPEQHITANCVHYGGVTRSPNDDRRRPAMPGAVSRRNLLLGVGAATGALAFRGSPQQYRPAYLRWAFAGNPAAGPTDRWSWQGLQGDRKRPSLAAVPNQLVYATAVRRASDPGGITQCIRPADVPNEWLLRDPAGRVISRSQGDTVALDVGNPDYRSAAAKFLVDKCTRERWSGVAHDEINPKFSFGWPGAMPARYPTDERWQTALTGYVKVISDALRSAGFISAGNVGTVTTASRPFNEDIVRAGCTSISEFFVAGGWDPASAATAENRQWTEQVAWAEANLRAGRRVILHDRQVDPGRVLYGLGTFLLIDDGNAVYGADAGYDAATTPYPQCFADAVKLGNPQGPRTEIQPNVWTRRFASGLVLVNSSKNTAYRGARKMQPTSALIQLT